MRSILIILLAAINMNFVSGQDFKYPVIISKGKSIADFIPNEWNIADTVIGDLNKDSFKDVAFVIENRNTQDLNNESFQHFILIIAFYDTINGDFKFIEQCNDLITSQQSGKGALYESIDIKNGIFELSFFKMGNNDNLTNYKFRYQENDFYLIGADRNIYNQSTQDFKNYSFNFLSKKWSISTGNDKSNAKPKIEWRKLETTTLMKLENYKGPFTWEVSEGIYL